MSFNTHALARVPPGN